MFSESEKLIPLKDANAHSPVQVHGATWHRWVFRGVGGIHLEIVRVGARLFSSREAILRFLDKLNECNGAIAEVTAPVRTSRERSEASQAALNELAAKGVGSATRVIGGPNARWLEKASRMVQDLTALEQAINMLDWAESSTEQSAGVDALVQRLISNAKSLENGISKSVRRPK